MDKLCHTTTRRSYGGTEIGTRPLVSNAEKSLPLDDAPELCLLVETFGETYPSDTCPACFHPFDPVNCPSCKLGAGRMDTPDENGNE